MHVGGHFWGEILRKVWYNRGCPCERRLRRAKKARVAGTVQSRDGAAYVLEFETAGGSHRLHYPKAAKGKGFAEGETVTLYYDPDDLEKMYVEGDKAVLGAEVLYAVLGVVLLVLMAGFARL